VSHEFSETMYAEYRRLLALARRRDWWDQQSTEPGWGVAHVLRVLAARLSGPCAQPETHRPCTCERAWPGPDGVSDQRLQFSHDESTGLHHMLKVGFRALYQDDGFGNEGIKGARSGLTHIRGGKEMPEPW